jgi:hypothetical protein
MAGVKIDGVAAYQRGGIGGELRLYYRIIRMADRAHGRGGGGSPQKFLKAGLFHDSMNANLVGVLVEREFPRAGGVIGSAIANRFVPARRADDGPF